MRSAVMVCVHCGGLVLRRLAPLPNTFALAWLVVTLLNPTDLATSGCQLSFLSVAVLCWGTHAWLRRDMDALDRAVEDNWPLWRRDLVRLAREIWLAYQVTWGIWLCLIPLVMFRFQIVSFAGLLIGPPVVLLTSIALLAGFLVLLTATVWAPLAMPFALVTRCCLAGCDYLVRFSEALPGSYAYVGTIPEWWLWLFYGGLLAVLTVRPLQQHWRGTMTAGLAWLCIGLVGHAMAIPSDELRCTFLAVGHGGCTVVETPDGRTFLYDAGAISGPQVTRRQIAPYLWHRGIRRIDEVFVSHADLDHFNGLPDLAERFAIGQVTTTPSFAEKEAPGVQFTLAELARRRIPVRTVRAGDRLGAGDVELEVLHPPPLGPQGNENARSLVLLIRHARHTLLLTGDLEGPGLARLLALAPVPVDVFMAPHHGSRFPNTAQLARWARPKVVVSCEGPPRGPTRPVEPYTPMGATFLGTWPHGAVMIRSHASGLVIETFQTGQRIVIR
jgi:competence protein ComEC